MIIECRTRHSSLPQKSAIDCFSDGIDCEYPRGHRHRLTFIFGRSSQADRASARTVQRIGVRAAFELIVEKILAFDDFGIFKQM